MSLCKLNSHGSRLIVITQDDVPCFLGIIRHCLMTLMQNVVAEPRCTGPVPHASSGGIPRRGRSHDLRSIIRV